MAWRFPLDRFVFFLDLLEADALDRKVVGGIGCRVSFLTRGFGGWACLLTLDGWTLLFYDAFRRRIRAKLGREVFVNLRAR